MNLKEKLNLLKSFRQYAASLNDRELVLFYQIADLYQGEVSGFRDTVMAEFEIARNLPVQPKVDYNACVMAAVEAAIDCQSHRTVEIVESIIDHWQYVSDETKSLAVNKIETAMYYKEIEPANIAIWQQVVDLYLKEPLYYPAM